ncbi:hypothetical protein [Streptomyces europaeiscabiei]|uniref:hypothetical protein n=1 Tax=Streptomyces europaeiscabiei TaxID=146819 RepID=UPI002E17FB90
MADIAATLRAGPAEVCGGSQVVRLQTPQRLGPLLHGGVQGIEPGADPVGRLLPEAGQVTSHRAERPPHARRVVPVTAFEAVLGIGRQLL